MKGFPAPSSSVVPYALVQDQKANTTAGGTFTTGAWQTRVLNTVVYDTAGLVSLATNQVTLPPGRYRWSALAPGVACNRHQLRLQNITTGQTVGLGVPGYSTQVNQTQILSYGAGWFQISAYTVFELQHRCETTRATDGFGIAMSLGNNEVFAQIEFWRDL